MPLMSANRVLGAQTFSTGCAALGIIVKMTSYANFHSTSIQKLIWPLS